MTRFIEDDFPVVVTPGGGRGKVFPKVEIDLTAVAGKWVPINEWSEFESLEPFTKKLLGEVSVGVIERPGDLEPFFKFYGDPETVAGALTTLGANLNRTFEVQPIANGRQTSDFAFNFAKIEIEYKEMSDDAPAAIKWTALDGENTPEPLLEPLDALAVINSDLQPIALLLPAVQKAREADDGFKAFLKIVDEDGALDAQETREILNVFAAFEDDFDIFVRDAGESTTDAMVYKLTDVLVTSVSTGGAGEAWKRPSEVLAQDDAPPPVDLTDEFF